MEEKFKEINEAYEVLSDAENRKKYDQLGQNWKKGADFNPPPHYNQYAGKGDGFGGEYAQSGFTNDYSDFFSSMFGQKSGRARSGQGFSMRGTDTEADISLSLEDAYRGTRCAIKLESTTACPDCSGSGIKDRSTCLNCRGTGLIYKPKTLNVDIPAGVCDGTIIRLTGQGELGTGNAPQGNLLLHVKLKPHQLFTLVGDYDLQLELPVAAWEAALGTKIEMPTLEGSVEINISAGIQTGQRLRLRGQGLKKRNGERGDLFVKVKIVNPPKLTDEEKELFQHLAAKSHFNARELIGGKK